MTIMEQHKVVHCFDSDVIASNNDIFSSSPASDVINMENWREVTFILIKNSGGTGTATVTVSSCDDNVATTTTDIAFKYRKITDPDDSTVTHGDWTDATASGFTTAAEADVIYEIRVTSDDLSGTDKYVRCTFTKVNSDPVYGAAFAILSDPRYAVATPQDIETV